MSKQSQTATGPHSREAAETLSLLWAVQHTGGGNAQTIAEALGLDKGLAPAVGDALNRLVRFGWLVHTNDWDESTGWTLSEAGRADLARA